MPPDFTLFTWFFVIPGVLLVAFALIGLFVGRDDTAKIDVATNENFATVA